MSSTPLADGFRRRKSYRTQSTVVGILGVASAIAGFATSIIWLVVLGSVLFIIVGFALWLASNATVARAIDEAAFSAIGQPLPTHVPEVVHRMNVGYFHQAVERQAQVGGSLDDVFRAQFGAAPR